MITLARVQDRQEAVALVSSALEAVRRINPMDTPVGRREIGDVVFEWKSSPAEPSRSAVTQVGLPTIFQVGLFNVDVRVLRRGVEIERFRVRQVGYEQTGSLEEE